MMEETPQKANEPRILPISGSIFSSPYDWGGDKLIPQTLGFTPEPGVPYAEYWLGVHKKAPSRVTLPDGSSVSLDEIVTHDKTNILGSDIAQRFGTLPFLFKLLEAGEMLSIQVHPNKQQAEEGFSKENIKRIPLSDPQRTYKDDNHKVEFAVVLGDFWLLHGFQQKENLQVVLQQVPEFASLLPYLETGNGIESLYRHVMVEMQPKDVDTILHSLAQRIMPALKAGTLQKASPDYWAAKAMKYMNMKPGNYDRGIFSIYILNLLNLKPGQAIFQNSGVLHAYLEGPIIEVMTTSDNVARGGITSKFIDVEELMRLVKFEPVVPYIVTGRPAQNEIFFDAPADEFVVSKITPNGGYTHTAYSAEILLGMEGNATITAGSQSYPISRGKSVIVFAGTNYEIQGTETDIIYKTAVPVK